MVAKYILGTSPLVLGCYQRSRLLAPQGLWALPGRQALPGRLGQRVRLEVRVLRAQPEVRVLRENEDQEAGTLE